jgi:hypothetical protein
MPLHENLSFEFSADEQQQITNENSLLNDHDPLRSEFNQPSATSLLGQEDHHSQQHVNSESLEYPGAPIIDFVFDKVCFHLFKFLNLIFLNSLINQNFLF